MFRLKDDFYIAKLWIDDFIYPIEKDKKKIEFCLPIGRKSASTNNICTDIVMEVFCKRRHASNYALLGARFVSTVTNRLEVEIALDEMGCQAEKQRMINDTIYWGLPNEYAESVFSTSKQILMENVDFPSGKLIFYVAAHAYIGSSKLVFEKVTTSMLSLLLHRIKGATMDEMEQMFQKEVCKHFGIERE